MKRKNLFGNPTKGSVIFGIVMSSLTIGGGMVSEEPIMVVIGAGFFIWGILYYKKKFSSEKKEVSKRKLYIKLVATKNSKVKKTPDRFWPEPFNSVKEIDIWWNSREDLWPGIEKVELVDTGGV